MLGLQASSGDQADFEDEIGKDDGDGDSPIIITPSKMSPIYRSTSNVNDNDDIDNDRVIVKQPQTRHQMRQYETPRKAGSEVGKEDYPIPSRRNVSKRLSSLTLTRNQKHKRVVPSQAAQAKERRRMSINSDIPSHTVVSVPEAFPGALSWASSYGSESIDS